MKQLAYTDRLRADDPACILFIGEDSPHVAVLKQQLKERGFRVCSSSTCAGALNMACQKEYELILLDVDQPNLDAPEICYQLKAWPEFANVPVVILSSSNQPELTSQPSLGAIYCLTKDARTQTTLLHLIDQVHYMNYRYM